MTSRRTGALRAFVVKELRHLLRDRQTLTVLLLMPLVQVLLFGFALRTDVRDVRVVMVDPAPDEASTALRARIDASDRLRVVAGEPTMGALERVFRRGAADAAIVVPTGFASGLGAAPDPLLLVVDASDPNTGSTMQVYLQAAIADWARARAGPARGPQVALSTRMRFNPTLESVNLFVPGLVALVLTLVSAMMTAISLSREKERGTLEVLLVSPLRPGQIVLGKVLPYLGLGLVNALTALLAAVAVFDVPLRGSVGLLVAESLLYTGVSLALGVLIAARAPSQRVAMMFALVGTMLPNVLLSGMIFPIASMPSILQWLSVVVPARWFLVIARGVMLKGVGLAHLWQETLVLAGMALLLLVAASRAFRPRLG